MAESETIKHASVGSRAGAAAKWIGLAAGPALAVVCYLLLPGSFTGAEGDIVPFTDAGRMTLAAMVWMGTWWLTEAIDISATALLPLVLFPLLGIASAKDAASPYASDIIFLFLGGFLLALSMQRWGLDRRIALITLRLVGTRPVNMIGGFMLATAMLSAFVSNTATAAMMLPIAMSVIALVESRRSDAAQGDRAQRNFAVCLLLGIAYAASIGGLATTIGTPPNGFVVEFIRNKIDAAHRMEISFARWMLIGFPVAAVFLPVTWFMLTRLVFPVRMQRIEGGAEVTREAWRGLGRTSRGEWITFFVFAATAMLWITRPLYGGIAFEMEGGSTWKPFAFVQDSTIAILGGLLLFVIPVDVRSRTFTMNWDTARRLPWGILILFGGGLSLAAAVEANGVAEFIGSLTGGLRGVPPLLLAVAVVTVIIFLTELTSNTATTATLVPILAALAPGLGVHPYLLIVPAAIAASCAFMMPVATPPNAIVFGTGHVTIPQMCRAGLWLNLIGIVIVTLLGYAAVSWWLIRTG